MKRLLSLVLSLALCLGLAAPALAAEEDAPLTRAGLAVLLARYGDPASADQGYGEELLDCGGLSAEEKAAVTAVVNARWMTCPVWGNFGPDTGLAYWNAMAPIAKAIDPDFETSSAPKRPQLAVSGSDGPWAPAPGTPLVTEEEFDAAYEAWEREYDAWAAQTRTQFTTLPDASFAKAPVLCEILEVLSKKDVLDPNAISRDMWVQPLPAATAEQWVKAAFGYTEPSAPAFTDVPDGAYYAKPVKWAVEHKITGGTGDGTTFSPGATCSNAQILMFLWKANGSPEPTAENPFVDLKPDDYYYKAALWAKEQGLISGSTLGGDLSCTRAMTVAYLWKAAGSPAPAGQASFTDVPAGADYAPAVAWAVEQKITSGTGDGTTFSPAATCTRGQIVTFLYYASV